MTELFRLGIIGLHVFRIRHLRRVPSPQVPPPMIWQHLRRTGWQYITTALSGSIFCLLLLFVSQLGKCIDKVGVGHSKLCWIMLLGYKLVIITLMITMLDMAVHKAYMHWYLGAAAHFLPRELTSLQVPRLGHAEARKLLDDMAMKERKGESQWNAVDGCDGVEILEMAIHAQG
jgi:hypothetical protein